MRICPKCRYRESPIWKRSFQHNPNGDIDVARIESLKEWEPEVVAKLERDKVLIIEPFAYLLTKRAVWVKRVEAQLYREGGISVFNIPYESGRVKK